MKALKAKQPFWVGLVTSFVADVVTLASEVSNQVTEKYRKVLIGIHEAGEAKLAPTATEAAIEQIKEQTTKQDNPFSGSRAANARRIAAAMKSGKLADGSKFTRDTLNLGWNELVKACPTVSNKGGAGKSKSKNSETSGETSGEMTYAQAVGFLVSLPTADRLNAMRAMGQSIVDEKTAPKELKHAVAATIQSLIKLAA